MDILVLNYEYPPLGGGAAPVCRDLAEGMAKEGHRITVVTMGFSGLPEYEMHDGMEIYRLNCLRQKEHSCMPWEQCSYILAAKRFLKLHLKTHRYDACHTHFVIPTGQIALWVKEKFDIPYIITAHGSDVEGHNDKLYYKRPSSDSQTGLESNCQGSICGCGTVQLFAGSDEVPDAS